MPLLLKDVILNMEHDTTVRSVASGSIVDTNNRGTIRLSSTSNVTNVELSPGTDNERLLLLINEGANGIQLRAGGNVAAVGDGFGGTNPINVGKTFLIWSGSQWYVA